MKSSSLHHNATFWMVLSGVFCGILVLAGAWLYSEQELLQEAVSGLFGIVTTPFFLEATVFICGLSLVIMYNHWQQKKDGDGWVYLAEENVETKGQQPGKHDAVFSYAPESVPESLEFEELEGLLALGSWKEAGEMLVAMKPEDWESPRGLEARLRLAEGLGQGDRVAELKGKLKEISSKG